MRRRLFRKLIAIMSALLALAAAVSLSTAGRAAGIASTTITVDGNVSDWTPVFMDPANTVADRSGADDPDNPGGPSRDLSQAAFTWDATNLYVYCRRTTTGGPSMTYHAYLDLNGNGWLDSQDMVLDLHSSGGGALYRYVPSGGANATDTLGGDGVKPPGSEGTAVAATMASVIAANGIEVEARVAWASLGKAAGSPIGLHFACGRNSPVPGSLEDGTSNLSMRYRGVSVTPDHDGGTKAGTTLNFTHTITNSGNATETFDLATVSSQGWTAGSYSSTGTAISAITLRGMETTTVTVRVVVPSTAPNTTRDVTTLQATCRADASVTGTAKDETMVGLITLSPYRQGGMAQSGVMKFTHTLSNNTSQTAVIGLTSVSENGWAVSFLDQANNPIGVVSLAPGTSMTVIASITVPAGTAIGTDEQTTLFATLQSDGNVQGVAYDTIAVRKEVDIEPNNAAPAGPGTVVSYTHTVTNSWSTTRTIDLAAISSRGWPVTLWDRDGVTKITSVTLAPFGGNRTIFARMSVPATAVAGMVDTTTVTAKSGSVTDTSTDVTTVSNLALYDSAGYVMPVSSFNPSGTVFARGMGLASGSQVRFRWADASGTVVFTSSLVGVDVTQICASSFSVPGTATAGTWTCTLLNSGGTVIATQTFTVQAAGYLTMSVDVSTLDFGFVDPGTPVPPRTVGVTVSSSQQYTLTPSASGDNLLMGLTVTGPANGLKPKGTATFFDSYQINVPWTSTPQVPLHATVMYTAIPQ